MSTSQLEEIKQKLDIVDVIGKHVGTLNRNGRNFKGICPFHSEKTPSFMVNPELQIFKCFGCGEGGDVISFIQKIERVNFPEALQMAAEMAGVKLDSVQYKQDPVKQKLVQRLKEANSVVTKYYEYLLTEHASGKTALAYANKRGITLELIKKFNLGFAPGGDNLTRFMRKRGYSDKELIDFGFSVERRGNLYDKFRERLMFPIFNLQGDPVGFSGRTLVPDGIPKFLNSPETLLYHKSSSLYGFYQGRDAIRKKNFVILFEGNVDIVNSHRVGIENVACPLGTALTAEQVALIKRYADQVYFCFDTDGAGYKALLRGIEMAEHQGIQHKVVNLGEYHDADDLIMSNEKLWAERVGAAENSIEYVIQKLIKDHDLATADGKLEFRNQITPVLRLIRDPVELSHFLTKVSSLLGVSDDILRSQIETKRPSAPAPLPPEPTEEEEIELEPIPVPKQEIKLLALMINSDQVDFDAYDPKAFTSEASRELFKALQEFSKRGLLDLSQLADQVSPIGRELLSELIMTTVPNSAEIKADMEKIYLQIYRRYLNGSLRKLKQQLEIMPDDEAAIAELSKVTQELHRIDRKPKNP